MSTPTPIILTVELQQLITSELAHHYRVVPKELTTSALVLYIAQTAFKAEIADELSLYLGRTIRLEAWDDAIVDSALYKHYRLGKKDDGHVQAQSISFKNDLLENIIREAQQLGSSDIHLESFESKARVRFRIDGALIEKYTIANQDYLELVNKVKIKANLDITEKRLPQDGRINYQDFDLRVSVLPTLHGEKIVMRILGKDAQSIALDALGLEERQKKVYLDAVKQTNGIVLISGPTGSGKTTTLYATLQLLNTIEKNIVTVEDPIEYTLEGINQVQLKENIGLTFSSALRSFLRQDPDIIMLGEIRDGETAQMAIRASLTGHLVLSTIHTNSAIGTVSRLIDMGVPPFYISDTLNVSVAQRLVRLLCDNCKKEMSLTSVSLPSGFVADRLPDKEWIAQGCESCYYTGFKGRKAVYEVIPINREIVKAIENRTIDRNSIQEEFGSIASRAFDLWKNGETSLEEIYPLLVHT